MIRAIRLWFCRRGWHSKEWALMSHNYDTCTVCGRHFPHGRDNQVDMEHVVDGPDWNDCTDEQRIASARAALPSGYAIVPVVPTDAMVAAMKPLTDGPPTHRWQWIWNELIVAAGQR